MEIPKNPIILEGVQLPYRAGVKIGEAEAAFLNKKVLAFVKKQDNFAGMEETPSEQVFPLKATRNRATDPVVAFTLAMVIERVKERMVEQGKVAAAREITKASKKLMEEDSYWLERGTEIYDARRALMDEAKVEIG